MFCMHTAQWGVVSLETESRTNFYHASDNLPILGENSLIAG